MNRDFAKKCLRIFLKVVLPCFIIFFFILFPINDLRHIISQQISQATQNRVALDFKKINLNIIPKPSLELNQVNVTSAQFSPIKMKSLEISPSLLGLITLKPGVALSGEGVFGGNLNLSLRSGGKNNSGQSKQIIQVNASSISLSELLEFLNAGLKGSGSIQIDMDSILDPNSQDTEATLQLDSRNIRLPENNIPTQLGAVAVPPIQITSLQLTGELKKNRLRITRGSIGRDGDTVNGSIGGSVDVRVMVGPQGPQIVPTAYDISLRLRVQNAFLDNFALKPILENFKSSSIGNESIFNVGLSATNLRSPPSVKKIQ